MNIMARGKKNTTRTSHARSAEIEQHNKDTKNPTTGRWEQIKHWYHQRPCWGAFCVLCASLLILWAPVCLLQSSIVPANTQWAGLLVGGLLFAMGLIELFAPSQALVAGAVGVVLALVSLVTALGGFGIGMLLAVIGSSYAVAWRPERKTASRRVFWSMLGSSLAIVVGMMILVTRGTLAVAAPLVGPYTSTTGRSECYNARATNAISQVDHRTIVELSHADYCIASNIVITQHVLGRTITITEAAATSRGVTSETVASHIAVENDTNATLAASTPDKGLESAIAVSITTNVTTLVMYSNIESATTTGLSISFS